jgi:transposase
LERSVGQVTVFSGPERRRRWSDEERLQIVAEAFAPGARVADVCRRHDVSSGLIYTWRRKLLDAGVAQKASPPEALPAPVFAEAVLDEDLAPTATGAEHPAMIIDLPRGKRLSVFAAASPALVAAALKALR